jgi:PUA-domain protein
LPARTILKDRDVKPLVEQLRKLGGQDALSHKSRVEVEDVKGGSVVFADGEALAIKRDGELIPVLVNDRSLDLLPTVTVDMGAVPHVVGGADIMAPGVRGVKGDFQTGQFLVVVDEKHGKRLAIGKALLDSATMRETKKGRVVENVHWVGDAVWDIVKPGTHS